MDNLKSKQSNTKSNENSRPNFFGRLNAGLDELNMEILDMISNESSRLIVSGLFNADLDELNIEKSDMISIETNEHFPVLQNSYKKFDGTQIAGIDFTQNHCRAALVDQTQSPIWESAFELKLNQEDLVQTFKELKDKANIDAGVVVVNGNLTNPERRDLVLSATMSQVLVLRIVNDTTAIFAANESFNDAKTRHVLILDVNNQRFQMKALKIEDKLTKLLLKAATDQFTEDKFDEALLKYCSEHLRQSTGLDLIKIDSPGTQKALQKLKEASLEAKLRLSVLDTTRIDVGALYQDHNFSIKFSRMTCQLIATKFLNDIPEYIFKSLREGNLQSHDITDIILIGNYIQFLDNMIGDFFPKAIVHKIEDSNETIVKGAAILAKAAYQNPCLKFDQFIEPKQSIIQ